MVGLDVSFCSFQGIFEERHECLQILPNSLAHGNAPTLVYSSYSILSTKPVLGLASIHTFARMKWLFPCSAGSTGILAKIGVAQPFLHPYTDEEYGTLN